MRQLVRLALLLGLFGATAPLSAQLAPLGAPKGTLRFDLQGAFESADRRLLERANALDPLSPQARFWLVMRDWQQNAGQLEDQMRGILELDPDYQPALQRYAKIRWFQHAEIAEAAQLIERALARDPDNPWLRQTAVASWAL